MADWRKALLGRLNMPVTKQNLQFLAGWQRWEGGHTNNDASFNWLNTTTDGPGAVRDINSVGVTAFKNFKSGVNATARTLKNGRYGDILAALKSGNPYKVKPVGGLSTWVSGSHTGNLEYASKVLGTKVGKSSFKRNAGAVASSSPLGGAPDFKAQLAAALIEQNNAIIGGQMPDLSPIIALAQERARLGAAAEQFGPEPGGPVLRTKGGMIRPGTSWKGTHVTDGLGWGTRTAADVMGAPGTPVAAPANGVIKYFKPQGAQGGGSMLLVGADGHQYWLGHIADGLPAGTRVKAGQPIAVISADHANPHLHIDKK